GVIDRHIVAAVGILLYPYLRDPFRRRDEDAFGQYAEPGPDCLLYQRLLVPFDEAPRCDAPGDLEGDVLPCHPVLFHRTDDLRDPRGAHNPLDAGGDVFRNLDLDLVRRVITHLPGFARRVVGTLELVLQHPEVFLAAHFGQLARFARVARPRVKLDIIKR